MTLTEEQLSLLWLSTAEIAASRVKSFISSYSSAYAVWERFGKDKALSFQSKSGKILEKFHGRHEMEQLAKRLEVRHVHLLFYTDEAYPEWLKSIDDFPYLLYYAGRLGCLKAPMIGVVGTREPSDYGRQMAHSIGRGLAEAGVTVVSGLARGIDGAAHRGALDADGCTVGVLGCGINTPYPPEHTELLRKIAGGKGLIMSEYPLDAEPTAFHFPYRNRIISGLSGGVVFIEGKIKSGGMHTVNAALTQGREVFAVPGRVGTQGAEGPHTILREGARIVTSAQDILDDLGLSAACKPAPRLTMNPIQQSIINSLRIEPMTVEKLALSVRLEVSDVMTQLSVMEIGGLVTREAGNLFSASVNAQG